MSALADESQRTLQFPSHSPSANHEDGDDEMNELDDYEQQRIANIKERDTLLASLGLSNPSTQVFGTTPRSNAHTKSKLPALSSAELRRKKELRVKDAALRRAVEPTRRSGRIAAKEVEYKPLVDDDDLTPPPPLKSLIPPQPYIPKGKTITLAPGPSYSDEDGEEIFKPAPRPTRGEDGRLVFEGRWKGVFTPNLTPEEMFKGGAFGGGFFADTYSNILKTPLSASEDLQSLPFSLPNRSELLTNQYPDGEHNRWRVRAGQSLQEWEKAGWIWSEDPRGWAQWYTRFWNGRRCADDDRQVRRWLKVAGSTGRFKRALLKKLMQSGGRSAVADEDVGAVLRQCLWQWAYELNEGEFDRAMEGE
ncbi:uncharacterized protein I303_108050 [Kwoniella dejecticola CBS 10117]|uniref:Uncharacterized protein n=1 Tax=Kwoniella dejecticola CBS 10117 TaxID=1296121 RepID=A0A1A5ZWE8_9TREE|nr:uncharacterized protein I303_08041 [Kwoniella dejecticola CBS 10117]OBR82127.1 hypothetical protein I303_08041 [Kwoniella dejecticola CBS 10117]